jgi:hypothetical protein
VKLLDYFRNLALKPTLQKECLMARRGDRFYGSAFLVVAVLAIDLAGCASIPYDQRDPSARTYYASSPGGLGSTPLGRQVDWTWQHHTVRDNPSFIRDNEICNAASKTNTATMMFGGDHRFACMKTAWRGSAISSSRSAQAGIRYRGAGDAASSRPSGDDNR